MEAATNARAHAQVVDAGLSTLEEVVQKSAGAMSSEQSAQVEHATGPLRDASTALATAVTTALTIDAKTSDPEMRQACESAQVQLDAAIQDATKAKAAILTLQAAPAVTRAAVAPAVNAAAGVLADTERAIEATQVAVRRIKKQLSSTRDRRLQAVAVIAVPSVLIAVIWWQAEPAVGQWWSLVFATILMVAGLLVLIATGGEHGLLGPIVGADNRVSTSKTQLALWTVAIGYALAFLLGRVLWDGASLETVLNDERFDEYLILLGGPFAAGVLAKAAVTWKIANGQLQKTTATEATPSQIVEDDSGNPSLVDAQYLIFNVVALGYFIVSLAQKQVLPEIPLVLFGLTSASAATYAANKLAESNAPVITSVSPRSCKPGQRIAVSGYNFVAGSVTRDEGLPAILIDGYAGELRPIETSRGSELAVDLPTDLPAGTRGLTVRTPARVISAPYLIDVLESLPVLFGLESAARPGATVTATGQNLASPGFVGGTERVGIVMGGKNVFGEATPSGVSFEIPRELPAGTDVQVVLTRAGSSSAPITVRLE